MTGIYAGTDTYGAVRKVDRTPIVTKFAMLQFAPIFPIESYYLGRIEKTSGLVVPLLGGFSKQQIIGLPLARRDGLSIAAAYVRVLAAAMVLVCSVVAFGGFVSDLNGQQGDAVFRAVYAWSVRMLAVGVGIGLFSYVLTFRVPEREHELRHVCGRWLGIAADPARIRVDNARQVLSSVADALAQFGVTDPDDVARSPHSAGPDVVALILVRTRAQIATGGDRDALERDTDRLMEALPRAMKDN